MAQAGFQLLTRVALAQYDNAAVQEQLCAVLCSLIAYNVRPIDD
jgi:hypothetical protein